MFWGDSGELLARGRTRPGSCLQNLGNERGLRLKSAREKMNYFLPWRIMYDLCKCRSDS